MHPPMQFRLLFGFVLFCRAVSAPSSSKPCLHRGFSQIHFSECLATVADYFCFSSYHCSKQNWREHGWLNMKIPLEKHMSHLSSRVLSHSDMLSRSPDSWLCCLCSGFLWKIPMVPAHEGMGGFLQLMQLQWGLICIVMIPIGMPFQDLT